MAKAKVYIETTIVSYLTACRPVTWFGKVINQGGSDSEPGESDRESRTYAAA